jgi:hypothetical protein
LRVLIPLAFLEPRGRLNSSIDASRRLRLIVAVLKPPKFRAYKVPSSTMSQPAAPSVGLLTELLTLYVLTRTDASTLVDFPCSIAVSEVVS